ncbi:MAG: RdgB/HAM1 family non-canonical purine NTP pyrophosphatase [Fibrobacteres bacterium]|nr:RdgB/HAM1 family non-canonical purine NTP pyrophosphatase [Fibrobacterota bacterium]
MRSDLSQGLPENHKALVIATGNKGKVAEFQALLGPAGFSLLTPADIGFHEDVEETGTTFRENALLKARALAALTRHPVLSDDSGLEVDALGGAPGLYSARYSALESGPPGPWLDPAGKALPMAAANRAKLLKALEGVPDRRARFRCVLCFLAPGAAPAYFEGVCEGEVIREERGGGGFGYDPIIIPRGYAQTFAELPGEVKDAISHRGLAVSAFLAALGT